MTTPRHQLLEEITNPAVVMATICLVGAIVFAILVGTNGDFHGFGKFMIGVLLVAAAAVFAARHLPDAPAPSDDDAAADGSRSSGQNPGLSTFAAAAIVVAMGLVALSSIVLMMSIGTR